MTTRPIAKPGNVFSGNENNDTGTFVQDAVGHSVEKVQEALN